VPEFRGAEWGVDEKVLVYRSVTLRESRSFNAAEKILYNKDSYAQVRLLWTEVEESAIKNSTKLYFYLQKRLFCRAS